MADEIHELSEDDAWEIALRDHPEWHKWANEDWLPEEVIGEDGQPINVTLHLTVHAVVERQLAHDDPKGVAAVARELSEIGLSRHDIRHAIGAVLTEHMGKISHDRENFDPDQYLADLRRAVEEYRASR